ncbi:hypothetical protein AVEN_266480-1 [Araneus ventricosus]|uniref:Uncharacterized protein n=1 Tax=Araneus ventricosus TaxID=182803 RepID=A0A4Y2DZE7_ARAVE|nr:hypothetical protein AVEN_266480-1 [Araneus ventricosus]
MEVDSYVPFTLPPDNDKIIKHLLEKEKVDDEHAQKKEVTRKEADELQTFLKFLKQRSSISAHHVMKLHCIRSAFLIQRQSCKQEDIRSYESSH